MANGKGTIMCCYCAHATWGPDYRCELHNANLPVRTYGTLNLLCQDFQEGKESQATFFMGSQLAELKPHMKQGVLYAFPYPSHNRVAEMKEVMTFKE